MAKKLELIPNTLARSICFKISSRTDGGTSKMSQLNEAVEMYAREFSSTKYTSITIQLEDGIINPITAKRIIRAYKRAAYKLEQRVITAGGTLTIDIGFVRL